MFHFKYTYFKNDHSCFFIWYVDKKIILSGITYSFMDNQHFLDNRNC